MTVTFRCPICKTEREASPRVMGRRVRCLGCHNFVEVGPNEGELEDSLPRVEAALDSNENQNQPESSPPHGGDEEQPSDKDFAIMADDRNDDPNDFDDDLRELDEAFAEAEAEKSSDGSGFALGAPIDESIREQTAGEVDPFAGSPSSSQSAAADGEVDDHDLDLVNASSAQPLVRWKEEPDDFDEAYEAIEFKGDKSARETEMDMTPMVDVTFLLLIFFMVTASFTLQKSIEQPPQSEDEPSLDVVEIEDEEPDYILVFVDEYNTFQVIYGDHDWECPSDQELIRRLREVKDDTSAGATPTELLVMGHAECLHERVVMAMDAGTEVGMASIQVTMTETGP